MSEEVARSLAIGCSTSVGLVGLLLLALFASRVSSISKGNAKKRERTNAHYKEELKFLGVTFLICLFIAVVGYWFYDPNVIYTRSHGMGGSNALWLAPFALLLPLYMLLRMIPDFIRDALYFIDDWLHKIAQS